jgi:HPt (histidine-containing phosphotransfer) domain-containing protein
VKGVAANLGIQQVSTAAEKLEQAIRDGDGKAPAELEQFVQQLGRHVRAIQQALREAAPSRQERGPGPAYDAKVATAALTRLRALLEASDGDAAEAVAGLSDVVGGRVGAGRLEALRSAVGDFDFEGALAQLDELARECGLKQEGTRQ